MKIRLFCTAGALLLAFASSGMNGCPNTMTPDGGTPPGMMSAAEMQLATDALAAINAHRTGKGLAALTWYQPAEPVAFDHCVAMETGNFFAHIDPNTNTDPATRAMNAGITHDPQGSIDPHSGNPFVGENLFTSTDPNQTAQGAVDAWVGSPGHHTQIDAPLPVTGAQTMPPWTHCTIGVRQGASQNWWTAMFFRNPN